MNEVDSQRIGQVQNLVIQSMSEGVLVIDFNGTIRYANPMASEMLDIEEEEMVGGKFVALFLERPENDSFAQAVMDTIYNGGALQTRIVSYYSGDQVR